MKTAVSLPDRLFSAADKLARKLGVSRSKLYARALEEFVARSQHRDVTARLDEVYAREAGRLDPSLRAAQNKALRAVDW